MEQKNTAEHGLVRELNLSAVLKMVYTQAPMSRAKLALMIGLNKSTISSLVQDLLDRGLIREAGMDSNGAGRPATLLEVNAGAGSVIAAELGVDFVGVAVADFTGDVLWRRRVDADPAESQDGTLRATRELIEQALQVCRERDMRVLGISFAIPGTVDLEQGVILFAPNLNWRNVPLREIFSFTGTKVYLENDANAAAVAEHLFGEAQNLRDFVFVFGGVGLGGGLYLNDQLYRGKGGYAGEIGHTPIRADSDQVECHCGNVGCWETYSSQESILRRVQARLDAGRESAIESETAEGEHRLSMAAITEAAGAGDPVALEALAEAGAAMGSGFAGLANILNPQKIVLGGPVSIAGDYLMPSIREGVTTQAMSGIAEQTQISISTFGTDASLIGAAAVVIDDVLKNPAQVAKEVMPGIRLEPLVA
jgi:glucokinase-like ROK family protein